MAKEMEFFSFLMEQYAAYKGTTANKILAQLEEKKQTDFVCGGSFIGCVLFHQETEKFHFLRH